MGKTSFLPVFTGLRWPSLGSGLWVPASLGETELWVHEDTNSILAGDVNRAIPSSRLTRRCTVWVRRSSRGSARVVWSVKADDHVGDSTDCWAFAEMIVFNEL